jgi:hypothetical protein
VVHLKIKNRGCTVHASYLTMLTVTRTVYCQMAGHLVIRMGNKERSHRHHSDVFSHISNSFESWDYSRDNMKWCAIYICITGQGCLVGWDCGHYRPVVPAPDDRWWWLWNSWLAGETEVFRENLPQHHFVHHKPHMTWPRLEPWLLRWETSN